jgi:hypothetical protein
VPFCRRAHQLAALLPWDDCNFGLDPYWARCYPYRQDATAGSTSAITLQITNHSMLRLVVELGLEH